MKKIVSFALILTPLLASAGVDEWSNNGFSLKLFQQHVFTESLCLKTREHYVGCRLAQAMTLAEPALSQKQQIDMRRTADEEFVSGKGQENLKMAEFWKAFSAKFIQGSPSWSEESALVDLYNVFLMHAYDPHTMIRSRVSESQESQASIGIGLRILKTEKEIYIARVLPGTPAEKSGLQVGDIILAVNDKVIHATNFQEASHLLRNGPVGSSVTLTISRESRLLGIFPLRKKMSITATREEILEKPFVGKIMKDTKTNTEWGWLRVQNFDDVSSALDLRDFVLAHESNPNLKAWVLDLRDNTGGGMDYAADVAATFLPDVRNPDGDLKKEIYLMQVFGADFYIPKYSNKRQLSKKPVLTLINSMTASAAEITASVLREAGRTVLIGERSFGKGTAQMVSKLDFLAPGFAKVPKEVLDQLYESTLFYHTTGLFLTSKAFSHQLQGLNPDFVVENLPAVQGEKRKIIREDVLYVNPVKPQGKPFQDTAERAQLIKKLSRCSQNIRATAFDQQLELAKNLMNCL